MSEDNKIVFRAVVETDKASLAQANKEVADIGRLKVSASSPNMPKAPQDERRTQEATLNFKRQQLALDKEMLRVNKESEQSLRISLILLEKNAREKGIRTTKEKTDLRETRSELQQISRLNKLQEAAMKAEESRVASGDLARSRGGRDGRFTGTYGGFMGMRGIMQNLSLGTTTGYIGGALGIANLAANLMSPATQLAGMRQEMRFMGGTNRDLGASFGSNLLTGGRSRWGYGVPETLQQQIGLLRATGSAGSVNAAQEITRRAGGSMDDVISQMGAYRRAGMTNEGSTNLMKEIMSTAVARGLERARVPAFMSMVAENTSEMAERGTVDVSGIGQIMTNLLSNKFFSDNPNRIRAGMGAVEGFMTGSPAGLGIFARALSHVRDQEGGQPYGGMSSVGTIYQAKRGFTGPDAAEKFKQSVLEIAHTVTGGARPIVGSVSGQLSEEQRQTIALMIERSQGGSVELYKNLIDTTLSGGRISAEKLQEAMKTENDKVLEKMVTMDQHLLDIWKDAEAMKYYLSIQAGTRFGEGIETIKALSRGEGTPTGIVGKIIKGASSWWAKPASSLAGGDLSGSPAGAGGSISTSGFSVGTGRDLMPAYVPAKYRDRIAAMAKQYNVPMNIMAANLNVESGWNPSAISPVGAEGLAQIMPYNKSRLGITNSFDPDQSIEAQAKELKRLYETKQNWPDAIAAYNTGEKWPREQWMNRGPGNQETPKHVLKVLEAAGESGNFPELIEALRANTAATNNNTTIGGSGPNSPMYNSPATSGGDVDLNHNWGGANFTDSRGF